MNKLLLFIDGSVNNQLKLGCGAYLLVDENEEARTSQEDKVRTKTFKNTSSTKLELQTLLWALNELPTTNQTVVVYTDSQNIVSLPGRRVRLEQVDYSSKNNRLFNNHELYRKFFEIADRLDFELVKVKGHQQGKYKDYHDELFTLVDLSLIHI